MSVYRYGSENSFTQGNRARTMEYYAQYGARYIEGLRLMREDLRGACADAFDERIGFQERDMKRNTAIASFCERPTFSTLRGLGPKDSGCAIAKRCFPDPIYLGLRRLYKLREKRRLGTLVSKIAADPSPIRRN